MKNKKLSLKSVINDSIASTNGRLGAIFAMSTLHYLAFLITFLITRSILLSVFVWSIFINGVSKYLANLGDAKFEDAFRFNKANFLTVILSSILYMFISAIGFVFIIFPAIMIFSNFVFIFTLDDNENQGVVENFKASKSIAKGYRGKIAWLGIIYLVITILFVGLGILIAFLLSLLIKSINFYWIGAFIGVSLFLILGFPIELLTIINMRGAIEQDRLNVVITETDEESKDDDNQGDEKDDDTTEKLNEPQNKSDLDDRDDKTPTDFIF